MKSAVSRLPMLRVVAQPAFRIRTFAKLTAPGADPLAVLRNTCLNRSLCDEGGFRVPGVHWVFSVAVGSGDANVVRECRMLASIARLSHM